MKKEIWRQTFEFVDVSTKRDVGVFPTPQMQRRLPVGPPRKVKCCADLDRKGAQKKMSGRGRIFEVAQIWPI